MSSQLFERTIDYEHRFWLTAALALAEDLDCDRTMKKLMIAVLAVTGVALAKRGP